VLLNAHFSSGGTPGTPGTPEIEACANSLIANEALYRYQVERGNAISGKRILFTTRKARLGTGPLDMKCGDVVALLAGFSSPVVLRERKGRKRIRLLGWRMLWV
jgi:hypothetical protein